MSYFYTKNIKMQLVPCCKQNVKGLMTAIQIYTAICLHINTLPFSLLSLCLHFFTLLAKWWQSDEQSDGKVIAGKVIKVKGVICEAIKIRGSRVTYQQTKNFRVLLEWKLGVTIFNSLQTYWWSFLWSLKPSVTVQTCP